MNRVGLWCILIAVLLVACAPATPTRVPMATQPPTPTEPPTATVAPAPTLPPWDEVVADRQAALAELPGFADFPDHATDWQDYAARCFEELLTPDLCWFTEPSTGIKGFRPYVKGTDGWGGADRTREITELIAEMDVLWPMYRYLQLHPDPQRQAIVDEFILELPKYYDASVGQMLNRPGEDKHDSWYFMENGVLKVGHLYWISGVSALEEPYFGSLHSAIDMAHNFDYLFPQFVNLAKETADGYNTNNHSTAGLLAYSLIHAYYMTGNTDYLVEAERALMAMRLVNHPLPLLYEPQEMAAAAAAAAHMTQLGELIDSSINYAAVALDFFYAQEQMLYYNGGWNRLPGFRRIVRSEWLPREWRDGLHAPYWNPQEIGGINAPAFKESFESVMWWADYLKHMHGRPGFVPHEALKVLNLNRIKNFYFFSPSIPDEWEREYGPTSLQYIPYEDIDYYALREYEVRTEREKAGYNGKQIYGAGETLWAYLLFEALGEAQDRNALIVSLNVFDRAYPPPPEERAYMVFNPYSEQKALSFALKHLSAPYELYVDGKNHGSHRPSDSFTITLPALGAAYITIAASPS